MAQSQARTPRPKPEHKSPPRETQPTNKHKPAQDATCKSTSQPQVVRINLEPLYGVLNPESTAGRILYSILRNYSVTKIMRIIEVNPTLGVFTYVVKDDDLKLVSDDVTERLRKADDLEKAIIEYARRVHANMIVYLDDGYEKAWAVIQQYIHSEEA